MSLLDGDQIDDLTNRINSSKEDEGSESTPAVQQEVEEESSTEEQATTTEDETSEETESHSESEEVEDGHAVPYQRFSKVIKARNKFKSELNMSSAKIADLEQQLLELQTEPKGSQVQTASESLQAPTTDWLDDLLGSDSPEQSESYNDLEQRISRFEVAQQQQVLEQELMTVAESYPNVPRELLLQSVISNPTGNLNDVAEQYASFIAGIEEKAIANHLTTTPSKPDVPPRPKGISSNAANAPSSADLNPKQMTRDERYKALQTAISSLRN